MSKSFLFIISIFLSHNLLAASFSQISGRDGGEFFRYIGDDRGIHGEWGMDRLNWNIRKTLTDRLEITDLDDPTLRVEIVGSGSFMSSRGRVYCGDVDVRTLGTGIRGFACGNQVDIDFSSTDDALAAFIDVVGNTFVSRFPASARGGIKNYIFKSIRK